MKILLDMKLFNNIICIIVLIISLQSWTKADDIRDFEIEGMSIGDSLLDYFSEKEILSSKPNWFKNNEYSLAVDLASVNFETYKLLQVSYKTKDKNYTLEGIEGYKFYNRMDDCINEKKEVVKYVKNNFSSLKQIKEITYTNNYTEYDTKFIEDKFKFNSGNKILIQCTHTTSSTINQFDLRVIMRTEEYSYFLIHKALK